MKKKNLFSRNKIIGLLLLAVVICAVWLYCPIKEGEVYYRAIKLPEPEEIQESSISSEKMVKKAKNTLENVFSIQIEEEKYVVDVTYESYDISNYKTAYGKQNLSYANINFQNKTTKETDYTVACDSVNGEIVMIAQSYTSPQGDTYLPIEELERTAKAFFEKLTGLGEEDILYFDDGIQAETYSINMILKDGYESATLYLDAFDGTVFYFIKSD